MENIVGWILLASIPVAIAYIVYCMITRARRTASKEQERQSLIEKYKQDQRASFASMYKPPAETTVQKKRYADPRPTPTSPTPSKQTTDTSVTGSEFLDGVITASLVNGLINSISHASESSSSSWGLDDSDSRKSVSDSFSSSWSSDSSSGSDSGPSSDW